MSSRITTPRAPKRSTEMESEVPDVQTEALHEFSEGPAQIPTGRGLAALPAPGSSNSLPFTPGKGPTAPHSFDHMPSTDDISIHAYQRWQVLRQASARFVHSQGKGRPGDKVVVGDSGQEASEQEDLKHDKKVETVKSDEGSENESIGASHFAMLQGDLHLLDEKMDILIEVMFKNLKYSKAIYMSSKKSLTGPGHETGAVAKVRFEATDIQGNTMVQQNSQLECGQPEGRKRREGMALRASAGGAEKINNMLDLTRAITMQQNDNSTWKQVGSFIWRCMEDRTSSKTAAGYFIGINCFLLLSIAFAIADVVVMDSRGGSTLDRGGFEMALTLAFEIYFTLEIGLRFLVCPARKIFWCNAFNIIDAVSALPIVIRLFFLLDKPSHDVIGTLMYVVPVLRIMKLLRRFETFHLLASAFRTSAEALPSILFTLLLVTLFFAAIIAYCEPRSNIPGYPAAVWYVIITLVGLAPAFPVPVTVSGKAWTVVLMLCGTLYMAIPIGIVGIAFSQVWEDRHRLLILQRMRSCVERAGYSPKDVQTMFRLLDEDQDGMLDFQEFVSMLEVMQIGMKEQFALEVFESFDSDCEGSIDFHELLQGLFPHAHWFLLHEKPLAAEDPLNQSGTIESLGPVPIEECMPDFEARSSWQTWTDAGRHSIKNRHRNSISEDVQTKKGRRRSR